MEMTEVLGGGGIYRYATLLGTLCRSSLGPFSSWHRFNKIETFLRDFGVY